MTSEQRVIRAAARRDQILAAATEGQDLDPGEAHLVRVVEYDVPDRTGNGAGELIVLLSTITDPYDAGAAELADSYHQGACIRSVGARGVQNGPGCPPQDHQV